MPVSTPLTMRKLGSTVAKNRWSGWPNLPSYTHTSHCTSRPASSYKQRRGNEKLLQNTLTTPSKIASKLDWYKRFDGTIVTINVYSDRLGLAVSSHPSSELCDDDDDDYCEASSATEQSQYLPSLALDRKTRVSDATVQDFVDCLQQYHVTGCIVAWPIQYDTGRMGASCGRTLYCLEQLLAGMDRLNFNKTIPFCLWDPNHHSNAMSATPCETTVPTSITYPSKLSKRLPPVKAAKGIERKADLFGRCPLYGRTSFSPVHHARSERYFANEQWSATSVWQDFSKFHWPEHADSIELQESHIECPIRALISLDSSVLGKKELTMKRPKFALL